MVSSMDLRPRCGSASRHYHVLRREGSNAKIPEDIPIFNRLARDKTGTEVKIVGTEKKSWNLKPINAKPHLPKKSKSEVGVSPFATSPECPHLKTGVQTEMACRYIH